MFLIFIYYVSSYSVPYLDSCSSSCSGSSWWSSFTCSIIIFSVDWAEVAYMFRGRVPALNFVVSWQTVRCLIALPLFPAQTSITPRSRSLSFLAAFSPLILDHWAFSLLKICHPRKGVDWCCLRNYREIAFLMSAVVRRPPHNTLYALIHGIGEILCILQ